MPHGSYSGLLAFKEITYHIYLIWEGDMPVVENVTFKAEPFTLDTIYFLHDSLHFRLKDFYSEYNGLFDRTTNRITGQWIDEDTVSHPLEFAPALPDTVSGLNPRTTRAYQYEPPPSLADGITTCTLADQHMKPIPIDSLMLRIINRRYADVHSILIARNSCLVVEEYFYRFNRDKVYNIQSATKSLVSALTGIAIDKGEIAGVNQTLCKSLPGYETLACNEQNKDITLHQLLTMSTGIPWDEQTYDYMDPRNTSSVAANEKDQFVYLLSLKRAKSETPVFAYNSLNHILMNAVLKGATHLENNEELTERLLKPLGIGVSYIGGPTPMGAIGDIGLRPRDMLKFGLLYLNGGRWNGRQVVPAKWVGESTAAKMHPTRTLGYGYFWWTREFQWHDRPVSSFFAWGYGGQYIFVVPEIKLVVVMSGSKWGTNPEDQGVDVMQEIVRAVE